MREVSVYKCSRLSYFDKLTLIVSVATHRHRKVLHILDDNIHSQCLFPNLGGIEAVR